MDYLVFIGKISICFILGIIIGLERQHRGRVAGIRTITLVALGSFLFVTISDLTANNDVTRIAAQVVSGIGFLGAGVILKDGTNIKGLNTAATLWCSAAVGTLTALGLIIEAIIRYRRERFELPTALRIPEVMLKSTVKSSPAKYTRM